MQKVSKAYKESMKSSLRERAYIMITFGLVNQDLQSKASISRGAFTWYSRRDTIFSEKNPLNDYASLEENFSRVDGSMYFLPRETSGNTLYDNGIVSNSLVSDAEFDVVIKFNTIATDFKGLTIQFGENYPVNFDLVSNTGQVAEFRDNTSSKFRTDEVFSDSTSLTLKVYKMKNEKSRCRIYYIMFGYGLVYYNDSVMDSTLETQVSPIGATVPQIDFSVTLKNYDHYFNVDNPNSAINYLETGQEMDIAYGYATPGADDIEWIPGQHLWCSAWESDDTKAVIKCQDIFRNMDSEYYKGVYSADGVTYYSLAETLIKAAGVDRYYIDPRLKNLKTKNPMPQVKNKEGLQIIANACRCVLTQSRDGKVEIKSNFVPETTITTNGEESYSNVNNIKSSSEKKEYASFAKDYTRVDSTMFFLPKTGSATQTMGYVSKAVSKEDGTFDTNPTITFSMAAIRTYYGLTLRFGSVTPKSFILRSYLSDTLVNEFEIGEDEIDTDCTILRTFDDCDKIVMEFTKTAPYSRILLDYFGLNDVVDFTMTKKDMLSYPIARKQELIKEVIVPCYTYQYNASVESVLNEEVEVSANETRTYRLTTASYDYSLMIDEAATDKASIIESGAYYVVILFKQAGTYRLSVSAHQYKIVERDVVKTLHASGRSIKWDNPLISDYQMAQDLAEWLGDYYTAGIEYEYQTRGNPELDANDIIYQENEFRDNMKVNIYRHVIKFQQAFSGSVIGRRQGD